MAVELAMSWPTRSRQPDEHGLAPCSCCGLKVPEAVGQGPCLCSSCTTSCEPGHRSEACAAGLQERLKKALLEHALDPLDKFKRGELYQVRFYLGQCSHCGGPRKSFDGRETEVMCEPCMIVLAREVRNRMIDQGIANMLGKRLS